MKKNGEKETYKDPVCGMTVSQLAAPATCIYDSKTYYFYSDICREKFESEPEKYTGKWPRSQHDREPSKSRT